MKENPQGELKLEYFNFKQEIFRRIERSEQEVNLAVDEGRKENNTQTRTSCVTMAANNNEVEMDAMSVARSRGIPEVNAEICQLKPFKQRKRSSLSY